MFIRRLIILTAVIYLASLLFPYWLFIMHAPTYPEKALVISVYGDRIAGDIQEWGTVSRLVGIKVPPPTPELDIKIIPIFMIILAFLSALSFFYRGFLKVSVIAAWALLALLIAWTQYRLYLIGHELDPTAPLRNYVKPFTPPVIGWITVAGKITVYHWPYIGAILVLAATLINTFAFLKVRKLGSSLFERWEGG